ncbi:MAG: acetylornithine/succinylornithine family transaminase [Acidobacteriota bacterium]|nr:acetylornithine/succinylornithine family transaminase [Acidobacteriota bacterium]MDE2964316.1 acetylornithine/succinylornithine family transaminase [Acidobacteriota bacterium]
MKHLEEQLGAGTYYKRNLELVRGQGARLWDAEDREFIDCLGGQGAANLGHANPRVNQAIRDQAEKLLVCSELFYHRERARLLENLERLTPSSIQRFFLCNSGSEAIEVALKFARLATGRYEIVAAMRGFHGKTFGALSATWSKGYRLPFEPLVPGFTHVPFNSRQRACDAISQRTAAFLVEVVQGEGGVRPGTLDFLLDVQDRCTEVGAMFVVDEVQTGFGRTGRMFASEHFDLFPDLFCMAKSMGGGLPIGATGMSQEVASRLFKLAHSSTFGGNPLACAAANAAISYLEDFELPQRAHKLGTRFMQRLRAIGSPRIREVRGLGLMVGVELKEKSGPYILKLMERGVLALAAGPTVIRFLPPLVIEEEDLDRVVELTAEVLQ